MGENNSTFNIVEYFDNIKKQLYDLGYRNKLIKYSEAKRLYDIYGNGFSETTFAREVLEVPEDIYKGARKYDRSMLVLKNKDTLTEEKIFHLSKKLIKLGYAMRKVTYDDVKKIYLEFGSGLTMKTFIMRVLNLSFGNYNRLKVDKSNKVIILKNAINTEEIKKIMKSDGYENYIIGSYLEFINLYKTYGYVFTEVVFATEVLDIGYDRYRALKIRDYQIKILTKDLTSNEKEEMISTLKEKGYAGKLITYDEFLNLYYKYGNSIDEKTFALEVLKISLDSFKAMKLKNLKAVILKEDKKIDKAYDNIIKRMIEDKLINKSITYDDFLELYNKYGKELDKKDFAINVLEISLDSYRLLCKANNSDKVKILKKELEPQINKTKDLLIENGYSNKKIVYKELKNIYLQYGYFLSERKFSIEILKISSSTYQDIRSGRINYVTILPQKKMTIDMLYKIKEELIKNGYENKVITIDDINILYDKYGKGVPKNDFINKVLEVFPHNEQKTTVILKRKDSLQENQIEELKQKIFSLGYYQKRVSPLTVISLYNEYGSNITFNTFINKVLGITRKQLTDAKVKNSFVRIIDINVKNTMEFVSNIYLKEEGYYIEETIMEICTRFNISLDDFILCTFLKNNNYIKNEYFDTYKKILYKHKKLWIGNGNVNSEIIAKYYEEISEVINRVIHKIKSLFPYIYRNKEENDDIFQEAILFFMETGGEIQNNFLVYGDNDDWKRYLYGKVKRHLLILSYGEISKGKKQYSSYYEDDSSKEKDFIDEFQNTEEIAISNIELNETKFINECINTLGKFLLDSNSVSVAKELTCKKMNIDEKTLKYFMKAYLDEHNVVDFDMSVLDCSSDNVTTDKVYKK